jgi:hypothetical protein
MELTETVETVRLRDLIAYSPARRFRLKPVQTQTVVSELVCYEPSRQFRANRLAGAHRVPLAFGDAQSLPVAQ